MTDLVAINAISSPSIAGARLPATYAAAKAALAECSSVDECQSWANKAEALAAYARMARDDSLRKMADRIQARAINRAGALLESVPDGKGRNQYSEDEAGTVPTRSEVATDAGMSERQRKTALRVANVDPEEFERLVESDDPPSVTKLAEIGTKKKPEPLIDLNGTDPEQFKTATQAMGMLREFAQFAAKNDPGRASGGFINAREVAQARGYVQAIDAWLDQFITSLE